MVDTLSPEERSKRMRLIRAQDTRPELIVRKVLCELGFSGYRLHRKNLPGKPDIAYIGRRKAIFVHGCFWHGHSCKMGNRLPKSNQNYWSGKIKANVIRDALHYEQLTNKGWSVLIIWECDIKNRAKLAQMLANYLANSGI